MAAGAIGTGRRRRWIVVGAVGVAAVAAVVWWWPRSRFQHVVATAGEITVLDGDTVRYDGRRIRLRGFDAPEPPWPEDYYPRQYSGDQEPWASVATARLAELLRHARRIELIIERGVDKYGRDLAYCLVDGVEVGEHLVAEGLAYCTVHRYGDGGHPELAARLLEATRFAPPPGFEDPHVWRRAHSLTPRDD